MNTETDYLKTIATEIAARGKATDGTIIEADIHLVKEVRRLEKEIIQSLTAIENFTQRDTYHFNTLTKLVNICDLLYETTGSVNANAMVLLEMLDAIRHMIPSEIRPGLKLAKAFIGQRRAELTDIWLHHSSLMAKYDVPTELIDIAGIPFKRFIEPKHKLFWGDYTWLKGYQSKLDIVDWENADCNSPAEALLSLLIGRDFNDDRFYIYCKKYIEARVKAIKGKRDRVLELAQCENLVREDTQPDTASFDAHANSVSTRLIKLVREKIDFIETHEREHPYAKLGFRLYKYTVAFFFKLLHEQKVFGDITFRELSEQIASTCTAMGEDIPANSITKKAYPYKKVDFQRMEVLLLAMLEYLRRFM